MRRNLGFFLRFVFFAFCCFNFSIVFGQTSDRADLTGNYAGSLKFPSVNLNGKATLSVEGNKFLLRGANGSEKTGRITAIKTGGDYVSIALMFEETPTEKITDARLIEPTKAECADPKSAKCGVNFGFIAADELEKAAAPKTISGKKAKPKTRALTTKSQNNNFASKTLKLETAAENKLSESAKENRAALKTPQTEPTPVAEKQAQTLETAPITTEAKPQDEASLSAVKQATDELRRAMFELKRATDEIKTTTDELRRFRAESPANTEKVEKTNLKNGDAGAPLKSFTANSNKTTRKSAVSRKSNAKKPSPAKANFSKIASVKPKARKSGSKSAAPKSLTKKEPAKPAEQTEKAKAPKATETKPSPSPSPSPAGSPNQNANKANVGKSPK
jgi:hypothetical protein